MNNSQTAYKIVEVVDEDIRTLFHGLNGSRTMPTGIWLQAQIKLVKDGTSKTKYLSGWHVFKRQECAVRYLLKFTRRTELLKVVKCHIKGDCWEKTHSHAPIFLAEWIKF